MRWRGSPADTSLFSLVEAVEGPGLLDLGRGEVVKGLKKEGFDSLGGLLEKGPGNVLGKVVVLELNGDGTQLCRSGS